MSILIHPTYFPSVASFVAMVNASGVVFEAEDNYQKQTYRNRMYMYGANGRLSLTIPIKHTQKKGHQKYKDVRIEDAFPWQKQHWKSLETAYRTSPFFEFYEAELIPIFEEKHSFLMDLNLKTIEIVSECLQLDLSFEKTTRFEKTPEGINDLRHLVTAKKQPDYNFDAYTQVFEQKHGYLENLSILDLLFNEGTNALTYLESQSL